MAQLLQTARGPITLRTTSVQDTKALLALRLEALTNNPAAFSSSPEEAAKEDWKSRAAAGHGDGLEAIFVAEHDGELVAMTGVVASGRPKFPHSAFIWGVYVRPHYRGQRLCEALLSAATSWATAKGRTIVRLSVVSTNSAAARIYTRCGFAIYGIDPSTVVVNGVEYDELLMFKRLPGARIPS